MAKKKYIIEPEVAIDHNIDSEETLESYLAQFDSAEEREFALKRHERAIGFMSDAASFTTQSMNDEDRGAIVVTVKHLGDGATVEGFVSFLQAGDGHMFGAMSLMAQLVMSHALRCAGKDDTPMCEDCLRYFNMSRTIINTCNGREPNDDGADVFTKETMVREYTQEEMRLLAQVSPSEHNN
jgi:hypothetical protein